MPICGNFKFILKKNGEQYPQSINLRYRDSVAQVISLLKNSEETILLQTEDKLPIDINFFEEEDIIEKELLKSRNRSTLPSIHGSPGTPQAKSSKMEELLSSKIAKHNRKRQMIEQYMSKSNFNTSAIDETKFKKLEETNQQLETEKHNLQMMVYQLQTELTEKNTMLENLKKQPEEGSIELELPQINELRETIKRRDEEIEATAKKMSKLEYEIYDLKSRFIYNKQVKKMKKVLNPKQAFSKLLVKKKKKTTVEGDQEAAKNDIPKETAEALSKLEIAIEKAQKQLREVNASIQGKVTRQEFYEALKMPSFENRKPPNSHVTFVKTCTLGSEQFWEADAKLASECFRISYDITFSLIAKYNGYIVKKTRFDEFLIAFSIPFEAAQFCIALQLALNSTDWPSGIDTYFPIEELPAQTGKPRILFQGIRISCVIHHGAIKRLEDSIMVYPEDHVLFEEIEALQTEVNQGEIRLSEEAYFELSHFSKEASFLMPIAIDEPLAIEISKDSTLVHRQLVICSLEARTFNCSLTMPSSSEPTLKEAIQTLREDADQRTDLILEMKARVKDINDTIEARRRNDLHQSKNNAINDAMSSVVEKGALDLKSILEALNIKSNELRSSIIDDEYALNKLSLVKDTLTPAKYELYEEHVHALEKKKQQLLAVEERMTQMTQQNHILDNLKKKHDRMEHQYNLLLTEKIRIEKDRDALKEEVLTLKNGLQALTDEFQAEKIKADKENERRSLFNMVKNDRPATMFDNKDSPQTKMLMDLQALVKRGQEIIKIENDLLEGNILHTSSVTTMFKRKTRDVKDFLKKSLQLQLAQTKLQLKDQRAMVNEMKKQYAIDKATMQRQEIELKRTVIALNREKNLTAKLTTDVEAKQKDINQLLVKVDSLEYVMVVADKKKMLPKSSLMPTQSTSINQTKTEPTTVTLAHPSISFDPKTKHFAVTNNSCTAEYQGSFAYGSIFGNVVFTISQHHWTIRLDRVTDNALIGVADLFHAESIKRCGENNYSWAISTNTGSIFHNGKWKRYANKKIVHEVQVKLDLESQQLAFIVDGHSYGIAARNVKGSLTPCVSLYYCGDQVTVT